MGWFKNIGKTLLEAKEQDLVSYHIFKRELVTELGESAKTLYSYSVNDLHIAVCEFKIAFIKGIFWI